MTNIAVAMIGKEFVENDAKGFAPAAHF